MDEAATKEFAKKYLEDLLAFFGVNVTVDVVVAEDSRRIFPHLQRPTPSKQANYHQ